MMRTAERERPYVQQSLFREDLTPPAPVQLPKTQPALPSPFLRGSGHSLRVPREQIPPRDSSPPQQEADNIDLDVQIIKMVTREKRIQALLKDIDAISPTLYVQTRVELQTWREQFATIDLNHIIRRGIALGILIVNHIDPALEDQEVTTDLDKEWLRTLKISCSDILRLILQVKVDDFLEICAKSLIEERELHEKIETIEREAQIQIAARNHAVEAVIDHRNAVNNGIKNGLMASQRKEAIQDQQDEAKIEEMNQQLNALQAELLELALEMDELGQKEEKIIEKSKDCTNQLQRFGNGC